MAVRQVSETDSLDKLRIEFNALSFILYTSPIPRDRQKYRIP